MDRSEANQKLLEIFLCISTGEADTYNGAQVREKYWLKKPEEPFKCVPHYLKASDLLGYWRREDRWIGLAFKKWTYYLILDIDFKGLKGSPYHNPTDIKAIVDLFESYGILLNPFRSSSDGEGIHLVAFFEKPVQSLGLAKLARRILEAGGYRIENGALEIKPDITKSKKLNATTCRLPFQAGYAPLDEELIPVAHYQNADERTAALFWFFENRSTDGHGVDQSLLQEAENEAKPTENLLNAKEQYKYGEKEFNEGKEYFEGKPLTHQGERSSALKRILYYLQESGIAPYTFEEERFELAWEWLKNNHNGCSDTWNNEGWEKCKLELRRMVFGYFTDNPGKSIARKILRQGRLNQEPALKKIDVVVRYVLDSEGLKGLSSNGSSVNISRLAQRFLDYRERAREDKSFALPDLTNDELRAAVDKKTLVKHRDRIHDLWIAWEESHGD